MKTPQEIWEHIVVTLQPELKNETYALWLKPIKPLSLENRALTILAPNRFFTDWLRANYQSRIEAMLKELTGEETSLAVEVQHNLEMPAPHVEEQEPVPLPHPETHFTEQQFNPRYTFDTFVVGPSNRFAQAAALAVAKEPGRAYNPLFIYGGVGLGKTHLLHAIGHLTRTTHPGSRVLYITSEHFINDFIDSLRYDRMHEFRAKYRNIACLMIDDIQFLVGKDSSQEEFFYTFNTLYDSRKQIVISSDRPPKETNVGDRLISRFEWGIITDIQPPDLETRIAILRKKAEAEHVFVPNDVILFIASQIRSNIRELEGSLIRIVAFSSLTGSALTVDSAREILKDIITSDASHPVTIEAVQAVVAKHFNLDSKDMKSKRRTDAIAFPRQIAMYLVRTLTELSTIEIGEAFGGKDHTTVMHACNKIKNKLAADPYFVALLNKITQEIKMHAGNIEVAGEV